MVYEWIMLFDSMTPEKFKARIENCQKVCPQLTPVYVEPENGKYFAEIFRKEIVHRLRAKRVISTYLDNDDALDIGFVEDLLRRSFSVKDGTFFYYDEGFQFYTEDKYMMQIYYPRNHFVSVVEKGNSATVKGIFGYGRHYYIDKIEGANIVHVDTKPMWCEVVHEKNVLNDANFILRAKMVRNKDVLKNNFSVNESVGYSKGIYLCKFLPRYLKTFVKRAKSKMIR